MVLKAGKFVRAKAAVSLTLTVAMGARAAFGADLTLYGNEIYKNVVVVSVTENTTVVWDAERQLTLANKNFWGKTRQEYGDPELFKLPPKVKLTDGSVLKSAKVLWFDQNGLTVQEGDEQRRCLYNVLPPAISARYPFTDATRAEYNTLYYKFQERNRVAQAEQSAREQAAATAQAESNRQRAEAAQEAARAEAANAEREDNAKKVIGAGIVLLLGAAIVHALGSDSDRSTPVSEEDEASAKRDKATSDMIWYNHQREEREAQALKEKNEAEASRERRAREQAELMARPPRF